MALALRREGHVEWVNSGVAGLLVAAKREVDLMIAEAELPDLSSGDLLRLLRILRPRLPIALVGVTVRPGQPEEDETDARFPKPVDLRRVLAWILDRLGRRPA